MNPLSRFLLHKPIIEDRIIKKVKKKKAVVYGRQAMNAQLPFYLQAKTTDYDIYARKPKAFADETQKELDSVVGSNDFYTKPAIHKGTFRVMNVGSDSRKGTEDDFGIVDVTTPKRTIKVKKVRRINVETLPSIVRGKKKILQDPKSYYRHHKDEQDLERIKFKKVLINRR